MRESIAALISGLILLVSCNGWAATFGNTSSTHDGHEGGQGNNIYLFKATLSEAGNVSKLSFYGEASAGTINLKGLIYDDDGAGGIPATFLAASNPTAVTTTTGWWDLTFASPVALAAGNYWIGIVAQSDSIPVSVNSAGSGTEKTYLNKSYASPGNLGAADATYTEDMCIYATYTASGGSPAPSRRRTIIIESQ